MAFQQILSEHQLSGLFAESEHSPVVIFKHSPRCSLSVLALSRFQNSFHEFDFYLIDVVSHRSISQFVAEKLGVVHESPQLLVIAKNQCIHHASHLNISSADARQALKYLNNK